MVQNHLDDTFDTVIISAEARLMKPDPEIYRLALRNLNVPATDAAFIDDTPANIEAANELGIHGILFDNPAHMRRQLAALLD